MTGGPNSDKHGLDYEFSEYDRNDMIFRFAKVPEDIVASYKDKKVKVETSGTEADEGAES
jgi:hypothetical protein